ncbi:efflux RND transporter periplasmic adaptor subunit [Paremcibacter congregatus]|uniref:CzcB-like barrel-sandwich hybrid domain-containing protein n=1 Tax=Paremcibacter congregatus TaxID=2043170 RepID=A0A2G4YYI8_9PROT|nr:efflux RND transporter periplasmic adaptor subunit [Paremcibacter congregatus]PHZ86506.1 hypothetical protein CRD36_01070 [Paremcibacter congregatus]QDE26309.1 efflux RND transporter periplasmic adaptor subunit [Paremcibacter congregatus]
MRKIMMILAYLSFAGPQAVLASDQLELDPNQMKRMGISTAKPAVVTSVWSRSLPARITIPNDQMRVLTPMMPGLVNVLHVAEGDPITKGQLLAEISSPAFLEAQQKYLDALSQQVLMKKNHDRNAELVNEGIISEKQFQTSLSAVQDSEANLSRSKQALFFAGLVEKDIQRLGQTRIMQKVMMLRAPFEGIVLQQTATTGEHVDESSSLYHLGQLDPLWLEIHVPFGLISSVQIGNKILVKGIDIESRVTTIGRMIHEEDQGILVRGIVNIGAEKLIPGQFIEVMIEQTKPDGMLIRVPAGAIIREGEEAILFVQNARGFALKRVRLVTEEGNTLILEADLSPDDRIAVTGIVTLKGMLEGLGSEE